MATTEASSPGIWVVGTGASAKKLNVVSVERKSSGAAGKAGEIEQGFSVALRSPGSYSISQKTVSGSLKAKGPNTRKAFGGGTIISRNPAKVGNRQKGQLRGARTSSKSSFRGSRSII